MISPLSCVTFSFIQFKNILFRRSSLIKYFFLRKIVTLMVTGTRPEKVLSTAGVRLAPGQQQGRAEAELLKRVRYEWNYLVKIYTIIKQVWSD